MEQIPQNNQEDKKTEALSQDIFNNKDIKQNFGSNTSQNGLKNNKKPINYFLLFELGIEFAVMIALPLIAFIYLGQKLDAKFHTKFIVIIGILSAISLSTYMISKKIKDVINLMK